MITTPNQRVFTNYYTCEKKWVKPNACTAPPSHSKRETLSTQIPYYTVFRFPATRDKPPQLRQTVAIYQELTVAGLHEKKDPFNSFFHYPNTLRQCFKTMITKISLHFKHIQFVRHREHCDWITKTNQLMPHTKAIDVYSKTDMKRIKYTLWAKYSVFQC
jgi:hypothetical protein